GSALDGEVERAAIEGDAAAEAVERQEAQRSGARLGEDAGAANGIRQGEVVRRAADHTEGRGAAGIEEHDPAMGLPGGRAARAAGRPSGDGEFAEEADVVEDERTAL